jgi:condensin complex subunit 3
MDDVEMMTRAIAKTLNDAQISLATHKKGARALATVRAKDPESFLPMFCNAVLPVLLEYKVRMDGD